MKNKIVSLLLAFGLSNAVFANSAKLGYASDYFYRGVQKSEEAVQASLALSADLEGVTVSAGAFTNQSVNTGSDSYQLTLGAEKSLNELFSIYGGLNHFEDVSGEALFEAQIGVQLNALLSPSVNVYRSFDDELYTFEVGVNHKFDLELANLCLHASAGQTDLTEAIDSDYYAFGANVSRDLSENASVVVSADRIDSDLIDSEWVFGLSVSTNF
jgi:hypothetical protein